MATMTADEHRQAAQEAYDRAAESFERSDTDGFLSQWASGMTGDLHRAQAAIIENGGTDMFAGLFDAQGRRVKAKAVEVADRFKGYGTKSVWLVLDANDRAIAWIPRQYSRQFDGKTGAIIDDCAPNPRSKMAKLGLHEAYEEAPAAAYIAGSGRGLAGAATARVATKRTDGGYPADAIVFEGAAK